MVKVGAYNQAHSLYNQNVKKKDDKPSADKAEKKKADREAR